MAEGLAKRGLLPDGTDMVGNGIKPKIKVKQTIESIRTGKDLAVEREIKELSGKK